jgi:hypothetical protein
MKEVADDDAMIGAVLVVFISNFSNADGKR